MTDRQSKLPPIPEPLMLALEKAFPNVCPQREATLEDIRWQQGAQLVVQFMRRQFDLQNTTILKGT